MTKEVFCKLVNEEWEKQIMPMFKVDPPRYIFMSMKVIDGKPEGYEGYYYATKWRIDYKGKSRFHGVNVKRLKKDDEAYEELVQACIDTSKSYLEQGDAYYSKGVVYGKQSK